MKLKRIISNETGASAVEFAIILPVLILLVFGIVQFGIAYNRTQGLHAAAREGARVASVGFNYTTIVSRVKVAQSLFDDADLQVSVYNLADGKNPEVASNWLPANSAPCKANSVVEVRVKINPGSLSEYGVNIPLFGVYTIDYQSSGQFKCEQVTT